MLIVDLCWAPIYHLPGNVKSSTVGFVYFILLSILTCSPDMSFLARAVSRQFRKFGKIWVGVQSSSATPKKFLHGVWVLVHGYLHVRFDLPRSINFRDINGSPNWRPITLISGSPLRAQIDTIGFYGYDVLLIINCTRGLILQSFRDIAFEVSNVAIFCV